MSCVKSSLDTHVYCHAQMSEQLVSSSDVGTTTEITLSTVTSLRREDLVDRTLCSIHSCVNHLLVFAGLTFLLFSSRLVSALQCSRVSVPPAAADSQVRTLAEQPNIP